MNRTDAIELNNLWYHFLRNNQPGAHTYSACINKCGEQARGGGRCATCLADEMLKHGYDVTKPQWSRDGDGKVVQNWHPARERWKEPEGGSREA